MYSTGAANFTSGLRGTDLDSLQLSENKKLARERCINNKKFVIAISESNIESVNSLLKKVDINFKDENGCSPLHWAVDAGDMRIVQVLVSNGADINSMNNDQETPTDIAKRMNRYDILKILEAPADAPYKGKITGMDWFNVKNPVSLFTGRLGYLERMNDNLAKAFQICITGVGGIGKTELVREYIVHHGHEYGSQIFWINAESYRLAAASFRQLASDKLNISLTNPDGKVKSTSSIIADVYQFLSKGKCLFIFDNAVKYKHVNEFDYGIEQFLPCLSGNYIEPNIIITSQNQKWPESIKTIALLAFSLDEANQFIGKTLTIDNDEQRKLIDSLDKKLQLLPLAVQQVVANIKMQQSNLPGTKSCLLIKNYLEKLSGELMNFEFSAEKNDDCEKSVLATLNITLDVLKQNEIGKYAIRILCMISYFLPENIPFELVLYHATDEKELNSAVDLLKQYSIVSMQHNLLSVHRLVQQIMRSKLQKQNHEIPYLKAIMPIIKYKDDINSKNLDHVISTWTFAGQYELLQQKYAYLSTYIMKYLFDCGRIEDAVFIGNKASTLLKGRSDKHSLYYVVCIRGKLAKNMLEKGEGRRALEELKEILELQTTDLKFKPSDTQLLCTKDNIVAALMMLGRNREALDYCYDILDVRRVSLKDNHTDILMTKGYIAYLLFHEDQSEEAILISQEIYDVQKKTLGENHKDTLLTKKNITVMLGMMNETDNALKSLEQMCNDQEATLPKDHPQILEIKSSIGDMLTKQKKYSEALKVFQDLLHIKSKMFKEDHPEIIDINVRTGVVLKLQGAYEKALILYKDAFAKQQIKVGSMHPFTFQIQTEIADVLIRQKKYADALEVWKDLLDKQTAFLGDNHQETLKTHRYILHTLIDLKKYDAALECSLEILKISERTFEKNNPSTFDDKYNVSMVYMMKNNYDQALITLRELLEAKENFLGKDHSDCQKLRSEIAEYFEKQNKFDETEKFYDLLEQLLSGMGDDVEDTSTESSEIV